MEEATTNTFDKITPARKLQVLFVDNNPSDHLYDLIGEIGFSNAMASEAVTKISEKTMCDAVVVDSSVETKEIRRLRKITSERDLPLILYSSFFDHKVKATALKLEADDYLSGSMRYTLENQIKLIKQLRKLKIQWLKQENKFVRQRALPSVWLFLQRRITDVTVSFFTLILLSPFLMVLMIAQEIELMEEHVFAEAKNERIIHKVFNWYQFLVLILFSPVFVFIKLPLRILHKGRLRTLDENRGTRANRVLIKKAHAGLSHLLGILKGDISLFGVNSFGMRKNLISDPQRELRTH